MAATLLAGLLTALEESVTVLRLPAVVRCIVHPWTKRPHATLAHAAATGFGIGLVVLTLMLFGMLASGGGVLLAFGPAITLPDALKQKKKKHDDLVDHIAKVADEHKGKPMPQNVGEDLDSKAKEAEDLWKEIEPELERYERLAGIQGRKARMDRLEGAVPDPALPEDKGDPKQRKDRIVGYLPLGEAFVRSPEFAEFRKAGMPRQNVQILTVPHYERKRGAPIGYVPLTKEMVERLEQKAAPTLGADVIEPDRLAELVRVTEHDMLRLRDVLNVSGTTSDSIVYNRLASYTRAAAAVVEGAVKPEAAMSLDTITESVRTQAVHIPVHNNQLADLPQLRNLIDTELLFDLANLEEEQVIYGDGTGENFNGIAVDADVQAARTVSADTLIDIIRRAITDVRRSGYQPNAVTIDPLDWEEIELAKGTDNRYVWAVIRDELGARIWSLLVVEMVGMEANRGDPTEERNLIVGDWMRGATLWVREAVTVSVGWINDQFTRNQRTILAEQRAAFGVKRPNAFRKHQTQARVT